MEINQEFWKAEHEAEQIALEQEAAEYQRLKLICPLLQKTDTLNEGVATCILCRHNYCETTDKQETLQ